MNVTVGLLGKPADAVAPTDAELLVAVHSHADPDEVTVLVYATDSALTADMAEVLERVARLLRVGSRTAEPASNVRPPVEVEPAPNVTKPPPPSPATKKKHGRPGPSRANLEKVAALFLATSGKGVYRAIMTEFGVSEGTAARYISLARKAGLLRPVEHNNNGSPA